MNLDQYRQIKEQESKQTSEDVQVTPEDKKTIVETKPIVEEGKTEQTLNKITIEGIGEVDIDELKNGYMRQSDYTKKTQEISKSKSELEEASIIYEFLKSNPEIAKMIADKVPKGNVVTPEGQKIKKLEDELQLTKRNAEISQLSSKYKDFNLVEVENIMESRGLKTLEDAYKIWKVDKSTPVDTDTLAKQIREQIMKELKQGTDTSSIIGTPDGGDVQKTLPELSIAEKKIAKKLGMSEADYLRFK